MIATCPSQEELKSLSLGQLPEEQSDVLLRHLENCETCQDEISQIDEAEDTFVRQIKSAGAEHADEFESEKGCRVAVTRALAALAAAENDVSKAGIPNVPDSIGEYDIVKPLGQGGMGHVYLGRHTKLSRPVAIKFIADHRRWDESMHQRFASEMRLIGGLKHPNIVVAHDAREVDGLAVLVTEYIDGMTVSEILKRMGRLEKAEACKIVGEVCKALTYIDSKSLVHRDIKPSNIMIDADGSVKLLDLGLARLQENEDGADFTATGQAMGTADYAAPEQVNDSRNVDIRSDLYGLGCTFYKLLSGRAPFAGKHLTAFAKMSAHVSEPPESLNGDVPRDLVKLVDKMLEKDPASRPQSPDDVLSQIEKHTGNSDLADLVAKARSMPVLQTNLAIKPLATSTPKTKGSFFSKYPWTAAIAGGLAAFAFGLLLGVVITVKKPDGTTAKVVVPDGAIAVVDTNGNIEILLPGTDQHSMIPSERVQGLGDLDSYATATDTDLKRGGQDEVEMSDVQDSGSAGGNDFEAPDGLSRSRLYTALAISKESPIFGKVDAGDLIDVLASSPTSAGQLSQSELLLCKVRVQKVTRTPHEDVIRLGLAEKMIDKAIAAGKIIEYEFHDPDRQFRQDQLNVQGVWRPVLMRVGGQVVEVEQSMGFLFHRNQMLQISGDNIDQSEYEIKRNDGFPGTPSTLSLVVEGQRSKIRFLESGRLELSGLEQLSGLGSKTLLRLEKVTTPVSSEEKLLFEILDSTKRNASFECFIFEADADRNYHPDHTPRLVKDAKTGESVALVGEPVITNEDVLSIEVTEENGRSGLSIELTNEGASKMGRATRLNLKKKMAIVVDGEIVSAPVIQSAIYRSVSINGDFTKKELMRIYKSLRSEIKFPAGTNGARILGRFKSANNMKQIMLAFHNYESAFQHFPTWCGSEKLKHPISWRVAILPFLGHSELYDKYNPDEPWDSKANEEVLKNMPDVFRHPSFPQDSITTNYIGIAGRDGAFGVKGAKVRGPEVGDSYTDGFGADYGEVDDESANDGVAADYGNAYGFGDVTDGTSNTVFVIESKANIPWTKPEDFMVDLSEKNQKDLFDRLTKFDYLDEDVLGVGWGDGRISFLDRKKLTPPAGAEFCKAWLKNSTLLKIFTISDGSVINRGESLEYKESVLNLLEGGAQQKAQDTNANDAQTKEAEAQSDASQQLQRAIIERSRGQQGGGRGAGGRRGGGGGGGNADAVGRGGR